ncbi:unnamed protein product [Parascedosporium putredinis]|uniref:Uncharacterized protein n=1 Tax=Parascedosporium putredinis TaxID=1442378 RepID=A0A9P1GUH7_9PEZI|nr:unnamed protein product [Parascedosporium putredinis]CAI7987615.1 unnamed protein product [Parascedosporium putredinis]
MAASGPVTVGGLSANGASSITVPQRKATGPLTEEEQFVIRECQKIVQFKDKILAGTHRKIQLPPQFAAKGAPSQKASAPDPRSMAGAPKQWSRSRQANHESVGVGGCGSPVPGTGKATNAAADEDTSFDENDYYSSRHDTLESRDTAAEPVQVEPVEAVVASRTAENPSPLLLGRSVQAPFTTNRRQAHERTVTRLLNRRAPAGADSSGAHGGARDRPAGQELRSARANPGRTVHDSLESGEATQSDASIRPETVTHPQPIKDTQLPANQPRAAPLVRSHNLTPIAPQAAHISSLLGAQSALLPSAVDSPLDNGVHRGAPAQHGQPYGLLPEDLTQSAPGRAEYNQVARPDQAERVPAGYGRRDDLYQSGPGGVEPAYSRPVSRTKPPKRYQAVDTFKTNMRGLTLMALAQAFSVLPTADADVIYEGTAPIRHSVAPQVRPRDADIIYERTAPVPAMARRAGPEMYEEDGVVYRRLSPPPYMGPRRVITQPEFGPSDGLAYQPRGYSVRPVGPPVDEYAADQGFTDRRAIEAPPRQYLTRSASVRPLEPVRYEYAADTRARVRGLGPEAEYAPLSRPESRVELMAPPPARDYGPRHVVQRSYSVRPVEQYYSQPAPLDDGEVTYIERPPVRPDVVYAGEPRREVYR